MNAKEIYERMERKELGAYHDPSKLHSRISPKYGQYRLAVFESADYEANAEAHVTAVNNTWLKSINPESVEDVRNALEKITNEFQKTLINHVAVLKECGISATYTSIAHNTILKEAKSALEKSQL